MSDEFSIVDAQRWSVPMLIALAGPSGSGKTLSGILLAAGMAKGDERVGLIDTENGRGTLYADDPLVKAALPKGYKYLRMDGPYTPSRFVAAIKAMEAAGVAICLIDSTSHEWEGEGGCTDIAENNKLGGMPNWAKAKREHKKFLTYCLSSRMHIIFCLRAREKTEVVKDEKNKEQFVPLGIRPIAEKSFVFEMLLSLMFDEQTHHYSRLKVPRMLQHIFPTGEMITRHHGVAIREWADGGTAIDPNSLLLKRARSAAELGMEEYSEFYGELPAPQKKYLRDTVHAENKAIAEQADRDRAASEAKDPEPASPFAQFIEFEKVNSKLFWTVIGREGYGSLVDISESDRDKVLNVLTAEFAQLKAA
jgi:hypothetical protein